MRPFVLSAVACVCAAAAAAAQAPAPSVSTLPSPALAVSGPVVSAPVVTAGCLSGKCASGAPCTPDVPAAKTTAYSTVTREFCVPTCSCFDLLLKCCGLGDDCAGPTGETRTKTLLVKKQVPKCPEACGTCAAAPPAAVVYPGVVAPTKP